MASLPLLDELKKKYPVCLSVTTATGYDVALSKCTHDIAIFYYPFDIAFIIQRFIRVVRPRMIILMESELWPNLILRAHKKEIPIIVLNGRISSSSQKRYRFFKFFYMPLFKRMNFFGVQSAELKEFLVSMGVDSEKVRVTSNIKFDVTIPEELITGGKTLNPILTAASTHAGEEAVIIDLYKKLKMKFKNLKLVLIPRHHERLCEIEKLVYELWGSKARVRHDARISVLDWLNEGENIFLVGTFGELLKFYASSTVIFVGKSLFFPGGGQNIIEPCALGKAVVCGPYMGNFGDVTDYFLKENAIVQTTAEEIDKKILYLLENPEVREDLELRAKNAVDKKRGIVSKNVDIIESILRSLR